MFRSRGWDYILWDDAANRKLWVEHFPLLLDVYDGYQSSIQRADATRLLYMHVYGGIYADLDVAPCDNLEGLLNSMDAPRLVLVREPGRGHNGTHASLYVSNFFMASSAGHPFWRHAIGMLRPRAKIQNPMSSSGPYMLNAAWQSYVKALRTGQLRCAGQILHSAKAYSFPDWQASVAVHHWASLWHPPKNVGWENPEDPYGHKGRRLPRRNITKSVLPRFDPDFQKWRGIDRSHNCPEAAFEDHINASWGCYRGGWPCPRPHWREYNHECNASRRGCWVWDDAHKQIQRGKFVDLWNSTDDAFTITGIKEHLETHISTVK